MDIVERLRSPELFLNTDRIDAAYEIERLRDALEDLMAVQNGPPLATYTDAWNAAMKKANAALKEKE